MRLILGTLAVIAVAFALVGAQAPQRVFAHASYVSSDPAADSVVPTAPTAVTIRFSEAMAPTGSSAQVLDAQGRRVDRDDSKVDANDTTRMTVSLTALAEGTYTVAWRNVSAVDGHGLQGSFVFFVGSRPADAPSGESLDPPLLQSRADPIVRWFMLLGAVTALGAVLFEPLILSHALRAERRASVDAALRPARRRIEGVAFVGAIVFLAGTAAQLILQAGVTANVAAYRVRPGDVIDALSTDWGVRWLVRAACLLAAVALIGARWRAVRQGSRPPLDGREWAPAAGLIVVAMVMVSLSSHGAAVSGLEAPGAINDGLHLVSAAVWVGGLVALLLTVHSLMSGGTDGRRTVLATLASRFSLVAGLSVGVLVATGLYSSWLQVTSREAFDTPYGSVLAVKVLLVLGILAFGALNLLWVRPRLPRPGGDGWLLRFVTAEVVLALIVIGTVAGLTSLEPARQVHLREQQRSALSFGELVETTRIEGEIGPGTVGTNRIAVRVSDRSGDAVTDASNVLVRLKYLDRDLSPIEVSATSAGGGRYEAPPIVLSIAGAWQVEVEVSRPAAFDARTASRFLVAPAAGTLPVAAVNEGPSTTDGRTYWSWVVIAVGALVLVLLPRFWGSRPARARSRILGTTVVLVGVVLFYGGHSHAPPPQSVLAMTNPYPPDNRSIEAGRALYEQQCVRCHGPAGHGDGADAAALVPPPADLTIHIPLHTDGTVFYFLSNGFPGTAMPAFANTLTEEQRWHLVNYLRTLAQPLPDR